MRARNVGIALATLALWPAAANAGTVSSDGGGVQFVAAPGERNRVVVEQMTGPKPSFKLTDTGVAMLSVGIGCVPLGTQSAYCPRTDVLHGRSTPAVLGLEETVPSSSIDVGDLDDEVRFLADGRVYVYGGGGSDVLEVDRLAVDPYVDDYNFLTGDAGDDVLKGDGNDNSMAGGDGNDSISSGDGHDDLMGGSGDDVMSGGDGGDTLYPGTGADTMLGGSGGFDFDEVEYHTEATGVTASLDDVANDGLAGEDRIEDVEELQGGSRDDTLIGNEEDNSLTGGDGDDRVIGHGGDDRLYGWPGHDFLDGGTGNDSINSDHGNDTVLGGDGWDRTYNWEGDDVVDPGLGDDTVYGPPAKYGSTTVTYAERAEAVTVTIGQSTAGRGGVAGERDVLDKVAGVIGGAGDDRLTGSAGDERLAGGPGSDVFDAGGGADLIEAIDGVADTGACGDGLDIAFVDPVDALTGCEEERR